MNKKIKPRVVFDTECYRNYWAICFRETDGPRKRHFEFYHGHPLDRKGILRVLRNFTIIGFNSYVYDVPMVKLALRMDATNEMLKLMSDRIIMQNLKPWDVEREFKLPEIPWLDHIDLIEPAPGVQVSLKKYGGRMHSTRLQDLPIEPGALIAPAQRPILIDYCYNDLDTTLDLYNGIKTELALRELISQEYDVDVRSKSDAQLAEAVLRNRMERIKGDRIYRPEYPHDYSFKYQTPHFISYKTEVMRDMLKKIQDQTFWLKASGDVMEPDALKGVKGRVKIGRSTYQLGIGGLHSCEKKQAYEADDDTVLIDRDVTSYYPAIILNLGLFPEYMGPQFLDEYRRIYERRIAAKRSGDKRTAETFKIVLNGSFGKFGSKWSVLYAPNLLIQVTVTGQLALLMLIESIELAGIPVISANTDGIVIACPSDREDDLAEIVDDWEFTTGFGTEETRYSAVYSRDVNNYLAMKTDGTVKGKGVYAEEGLRKDPTNQVCVDAVIAYLRDGTSLMDTIEWCADIRKFLNVRKVAGGALFRDQYLGRVVRWYYARGSEDCIRSMKKGDKVARTDGCKPLMHLDGTLPNDIDYDRYVSEAHSIIGDLGVL